MTTTVVQIAPQIPLTRRRVIDPDVFRETIKKNVYDPARGARMVYKVRPSGSYGGSVAIDLAGCSYRCAYCWVNPDVLTGGGPIIEKMRAAGKQLFFTPGEAFARVRRFIEKLRLPNIQFTGAETFLVPEWTLEFAKIASRYFEREYPFRIPRKYSPGAMWIDTQGYDLIKDQTIFEGLGRDARLRKHVRLFISLKAHPDDYAKTTGVDAKHADAPFRALELAWQHRIIAFPQMLDNLFHPHQMEWVFERLRRIHRNAPRILELDGLQLFGFRKDQNVEHMKRAGFVFGKGGDLTPRATSIKAWQETLARHYGKNCATPPYSQPLGYFDCDTTPLESVELLKKWIFNSSSR